MQGHTTWMEQTETILKQIENQTVIKEVMGKNVSGSGEGIRTQGCLAPGLVPLHPLCPHTLCALYLATDLVPSHPLHPHNP